MVTQVRQATAYSVERMVQMGELVIPQIVYDGGQVDTLWDNHETAIEWYDKYLSLVPSIRANKEDFQFDKNAQAEMMTFYPGMFNLQSVITSKRLVHLFAERGTIDPLIRWCFQTKNLEKEHSYFKENNIRISDIYLGPGDMSYFDFWATTEGTRFTAVGAPDLPDDGPRYSEACMRIGVSDLRSSAQWYKKYLGFTPVEEDSDKNWSKMHALWAEYKNGERVQPIVKKYPIFLEKLPQGSSIDRIDGPCRPYFLIDNSERYEDYHQLLKEDGLWVSPIGDGLGTFHFYDLDGNRINVCNF